MDHLVVSVNTTEGAKRIYSQTIKTINATNTNLRTWCTNHAIVRENLGEGSAEIMKVLRIEWLTITNQLAINWSLTLKGQDNRLATEIFDSTRKTTQQDKTVVQSCVEYRRLNERCGSE